MLRINPSSWILALYLFPLSGFCLVDAENSIKSPGLSISTSGFLSTKLDPTSENAFNSLSGTNHHGALYSDFLPTLQLADGVQINLRLNLANPSLSEYDAANARWFLNGEVARPILVNSSPDTLGMWRMEAGDLGTRTLGRGLTVRDFQATGVSGLLALKSMKLQFSTWAQDYDIDGDILIGEVSFPSLHAGVSTVYWLDTQPSTSGSFYLAPHLSIPFRWFSFYGEAGLKFPGDEEEASNDDWGYPDWTWAALAGFSFRSKLKGLKISLDAEYRIYEENFIPLTAVKDEQYTSLFNYDKSSNNWIDFFSSVERNHWIYLRTIFESPSWKSLSLFLDNELLIYLSQQDLFWDQAYSALVAYDPSSDYYSMGIRCLLSEEVSLEALMTNRLINVDPRVNRTAQSDLSLMQYGPAVGRQYKSRFFPADNPVVELRMVWGIGVNRIGPTPP